MSDFIANVRSTAIGTLCSALIVVPMFARVENALFWVVWIAVLVLLDGLRLKHTLDFDSNTTDYAYVRRNAIYATILAVFCGANWAVAFAVFWQLAESAGEFLALCVLAAGIMATAVLQYRHLQSAAYSLLASCIVAGTAIAFMYPVNLTITIILITWLHGSIILFGIYKHSCDYRKRLIEEFELERSEQTVRLLLHEYEESTSDWLWEVDEAGRLFDITERFSEVAEQSKSDLEGLELPSLFVEGPDREVLKSHLSKHEAFRDLAIEVDRGGPETWWSVSAKPLERGTMRGVMSDVTAQVLAEKQLSQIARSDTLTGLANRRRFNELLSDLSGKVANDQSLLFIDLDKFKVINDTLGHEFGDLLLIAVSKRITHEVGAGSLVARLGGDEFAVISHAKIGLQGTNALADRIVKRLSDPFNISGRDIRVSASIGIAYNIEGDASSGDWMRRADLALYAAKNSGRDCYREYNPTLHELERNRQELELDLKTALINGELTLDFQSQLDFATGKTSGMEALVRWNHPSRGLVMPGEFIGIAEENGLILPIGEWVVREAIRQASEWREPLTVALNLSPLQIRSENFITILTQALTSTGIAPDRVELEITETTLLHDTVENVEKLHKLRSLGVRIALDDFGTGYSSLNYLRAFPFDTIKIDRCFVSNLSERPDCQAIIRAVVGLAQELDMQTIAEGIEEEEQFAWLAAAGCTTGQGFYISRPISAEQLQKDIGSVGSRPAGEPNLTNLESSPNDTSKRVERTNGENVPLKNRSA